MELENLPKLSYKFFKQSHTKLTVRRLISRKLQIDSRKNMRKIFNNTGEVVHK